MPTERAAPYPEVVDKPSFPAIEAAILAWWAADGTFAASVAARHAGSPSGAEGGEGHEYVFYDGPPFANGLPHYGHLLTGYVKDAVPRYRTMRGQRVERRFGWDCHGLPAETEAEKELGVSGRGPITEYGIERFNSYCRSSVLRYTHEWQRYVTRQARWVDFANDYKTMDLTYMESVMWALKQLWDKGLLYQNYRVLPYCWECETPLSNFETRQDNAYRDRQDPAVTVAFTLEADPGAPSPVAGPVQLWVWTTTPWTLPSNLALAVGPSLTYSVFDLAGGARVVIGEGTVAGYASSLEGAVQVGAVAGADLVGRRYRPLFAYFADAPNAFRVLAGDFVSTDEGTGAVHMAPGFGEDDQLICAANGIDVICPVDDRTRFTAEVPDFEGLQVFEANQPVIRRLREDGALVRADSYVHSYPHCWRTDTPLVYKAVTSWFVRVTALKDRMLANNQVITWVPAHVRDGAFGKWLEGARDWSISRNRFWGSPIPVWTSDDPAYPRLDFYGSLDDLERDFGVRPTDLHRPAIDDLTRPNPDDPTGRSTMRRVTDVLDCWFESGSMPFAQVHYPFENREWFDGHFPGDFVVEYIGQTRGWFYTLHVLATALFDRPAFKTCLAHGIVLGSDGQKMSKRLRNYPDPAAMFEEHGADAMRWFLLSSPVVRGGDLVADERGITDAVRAALLPLWNAWYFFSLYANADGRRAELSRDWRAAPGGVLERYAVAKAHDLVVAVSAAMDDYDLAGACGAIEAFLDALNNWYIRRSRERFWGTKTAPVEPAPAGPEGHQQGPAGPEGHQQGRRGSSQDAFDALGTVLEVLCRVAAPLLPMVTEEVWRGLTSNRSVHLADWPDPADLPGDPDLVAIMDRVRDVCSAAHSVRKAQGRRARLPLASLTVAAPDAALLEPLADLIAEEVNVKEVILTGAVDEVADRKLTVAFKVAAPRLGAQTPAVAAAAKAGDWELGSDGRARVGAAVLEGGEFEMRLVPQDPATSRSLAGTECLVVLDVDLRPDLVAEGLARDVVRAVQNRRRDEGLDVTDRIRAELLAPADVAEAVEAHRSWVAEQTLSTDLDVRSVADAPVSVRRAYLSAGDGGDGSAQQELLDALAESAEPADSGGWVNAVLPTQQSVWLRVTRRNS
ncbi:MAG TPA: isoleucine--tRNA ligase [Acidimicrobiales bacterium]|nr:isoleucine--tRNA ligase [Acidimicrobiales bacterium]